ncbi:MAG: RhuM family protein [bacterium]
MSEGQQQTPATIRNFRIVQAERPLAGSVVRESLMTARRRPVAMAEWADKLDAFLSFNERDVLTHAGRLRMEVAQKLAADRFEAFDAKRRATEVLAADEADIAQLEEMEKAARKGGEDA